MSRWGTGLGPGSKVRQALLGRPQRKQACRRAHHIPRIEPPEGFETVTQSTGVLGVVGAASPQRMVATLVYAAIRAARIGAVARDQASAPSSPATPTVETSTKSDWAEPWPVESPLSEKVSPRSPRSSPRAALPPSLLAIAPRSPSIMMEDMKVYAIDQAASTSWVKDSR
eukprot:CAMPEP_0115207700 /NCGR_PEP_ID=MMETSP0270-20121206/20849_1 /TAXON_ID=71861 /ORGANISM="Scrippsiella trochoidea, Strain CCMP3099" /LENGTH=169 /DNA_ID=CAMNT_0002621297 /DNA_START=51 /DNA_END=556 /DNA_ORIENTATION=+